MLVKNARQSDLFELICIAVTQTLFCLNFIDLFIDWLGYWWEFFPTQVHNGPPHDSNFGYSYSKRMIDVLNR